MSALEQEILEKIRLLDKEAKQRIRQQLEQEEDSSLDFSVTNPMSAEEGLEWARAFRAELKAKYGDREIPNSTDLVNEVREEN